jgi:hypothetical protein
MTTKTTNILLVLNLLFLGGILIRQSAASQSFAMQSSAQSATKDNEELIRMEQDDQTDRTPPAGKSFDREAAMQRDDARLARVKELYRQNKLQTSNDYYRAALILHHSSAPEDYLLAHELCVVAISKWKPNTGALDARGLAAASEDRFLMSIDRPQRFGTQYRPEDENAPVKHYKLYKTDSGVTDELRGLMNVPSLAAAKAREAEMGKYRR